MEQDEIQYQRAVFLDTDWLGPDVSLEGLKQLPLDWTLYPDTLPSEIIERMAGAQIAVGKYPLFTREVFQALPSLQLICVAATGVDCIDLEAAKEAGVAVCNAPGYSTFSVAQHVMLLMLTLSVNYSGQETASGFFYGYPIRELKGKALGIIGFGNIGREVARLAMTFGMKILVAEHPDKPSSHGALPLDEVLRASDFITLHLPLKDSTRRLIGERELSLMKPTACLINTARGGLIDEEDLAEALRKKMIAGAALDVLSQEPPPPDHPLMSADVPNLILTPHIAWSSREARMRLINIIEQNISAFLRGGLMNEVIHQKMFQ